MSPERWVGRGEHPPQRCPQKALGHPLVTGGPSVLGRGLEGPRCSCPLSCGGRRPLKRPRSRRPQRAALLLATTRHPFLPAASTHASLNSQAARHHEHSPIQERQSARPRRRKPRTSAEESSPQWVRAPCSVSSPFLPGCQKPIPGLCPAPSREASSDPPPDPPPPARLSGFRTSQVSGPELLCQVLLRGCCPDPWNPITETGGASERR